VILLRPPISNMDLLIKKMSLKTRKF
jgi:hypothetical protein